jgi:GUN4-like
MNNPQQPREYDAVLGGNSPSLEGAAILGGIEGVKLRLKNPDAKVRIAALEQALNYGEQGLDLVLIEGLNDESVEVQKQAHFLLKSRTEIKVKKALIQLDAHLRIEGLTSYSKLRNYLAQGKLEDADCETREAMVRATFREHKGYLRMKDFDNFPCEDLQIIDQLWLKYSGGRFGFSVQKRIYQSLGGTKEYNEKIWNAFGEAVGWKLDGRWLQDKDISFDKRSPEGHLPVGRLLWFGRWGCSCLFISRFASKL